MASKIDTPKSCTIKELVPRPAIGWDNENIWRSRNQSSLRKLGQ